MINIKMQPPKDAQKLSPKIVVIGVGGAGGNAVNNMISSGLEGCEFIVCNSDAQALEHSLCPTKIQLGANVTGGLGAGSKPEIGEAAAEESIEDVLHYLDGANMAFVTAGMGGGTGTGAAPVIAKACRERGILTVGVVTKPFHFEGTHRMKMAESGLEEMQQYVDTLIVIPNQNLFRVANEKTTFAEGFKMADSVLQSGVRGVTDLMVRPGLVNLDFADIRTAMLEMGKAMMGTGEATGEKRAIEAAESAINNPLLDDVTMKGAHGVIINVTGGYDMTLFEADEACNRIRDEVDPNANIIFGATFDESMEGTMRVSIVATGIEKEANARRRPVGSSGTKIERAQPNQTSAIEDAAEVKSEPEQPKANMPAEASSVSAPTTSGYKTGAANLRGITAPPAVTAKIEEPAETEGELFEQAQLTDEQNAADAQNTALRGTRYKDSFIPPRPILPAPQEEAIQTQAQPVQEVAHQAVSSPFPSAPARAENAPQQTSHAAPGLVLNPPRPQMAQPHTTMAEPPRAPSFLEKLAGTVQNLTGAQREERYTQPPAQRTTPPAFSGNAVPQAAAQGQLNIDAPAAPKKAEDELDIPAFLRRQAN